MVGEINVTLFQSTGFEEVRVVFWREIEDGIKSYEPSQKEDGQIYWVWKEYLSDEAPEGAFKIPGMFSKGTKVLQLLVDELEAQFGISAAKSKPHENELTATRAHLGDLQKIVFKSDWAEFQRGAPQMVKEEEEPDAEV